MVLLKYWFWRQIKRSVMKPKKFDLFTRPFLAGRCTQAGHETNSACFSIHSSSFHFYNALLYCSKYCCGSLSNTDQFVHAHTHDTLTHHTHTHTHHTHTTHTHTTHTHHTHTHTHSQPKKIKNISYDTFGTKVGRVHMQRQDLSKLQTRKLKGLKRSHGDKDIGSREGDSKKLRLET